MGDLASLKVENNGVAVLTIDHLSKYNAFDLDLLPHMVKVLEEVHNNNDIKVLVITGTGPAFSAGGDISLLASMDSPGKAKETFDLSTSIVRRVYEIEKPVIAAVNGVTAGAATALMMACDLAVASSEARVLFSFINIAFCPDSGCSYFLTRKVGYHKAAELLWFGRALKAEEALELGLVNKVVAPDEVMPQALKWAERLARGPLVTIGMDKKLLRQSMVNDFYQQAEMEGLYQVLAWATDDFKEGARAFLEKRKPEFRGK